MNFLLNIQSLSGSRRRDQVIRVIIYFIYFIIYFMAEICLMTFFGYKDPDLFKRERGP